MKADSRHELEDLVEDIRALVVRLRPQDQPLATQLLEMAVLELRSRMHGIGDDELQALVDVLSGKGSPAAETELAEIGDLNGLPARASPTGRVVALGEARRAKCKLRS
jgi:hypothetical protein